MNDVGKIILAINYFILFLALIVAAGNLSGCSNTTTDDPHARFQIVDEQEAIFDGDFYEVIDRKNGVHYFYIQNSFGAGLSPMYGADGKILMEEETS